MILRRINNSREVKFFFNENKEERLVFFNLQTYYSFPRRELSSTTHWQNIFLAVAMPTKGYVYAFNHNGMHFVCKRYAFDKAGHNLNDVYSFSSFKEVRLDFSQFEGSDIRVDKFEYNNILEDKN